MHVLVRDRMRPPVRGRIGADAAVVAAVAVLTVANLTDNRWAPRWYLLTSAVTIAILLLLVWWSGGTWKQLGMARGSLRRGARWAAGVLGLVATVYTVAALIPATRTLFADRRSLGMSGHALLFQLF